MECSCMGSLRHREFAAPNAGGQTRQVGNRGATFSPCRTVNAVFLSLLGVARLTDASHACTARAGIGRLGSDAGLGRSATRRRLLLQRRRPLRRRRGSQALQRLSSRLSELPLQLGPGPVASDGSHRGSGAVANWCAHRVGSSPHFRAASFIARLHLPSAESLMGS
jgi:hypothetical protein